MSDEAPDLSQKERLFGFEEDLSGIAVPAELPLLPLRGVVIFPSAIVPLLISRGPSLKVVEWSDASGPQFHRVTDGIGRQIGLLEARPGVQLVDRVESGVRQLGEAVAGDLNRAIAAADIEIRRGLRS